MARSVPVSGLRQWLIHQLVASFWLLPIIAIIMAPLVAYAGFWLDAPYVTPWLVRHGLFPVVSADTAQDYAIAAMGLDAALLALYISITLIVLTLATGTLGVRLVDRWLDKWLIRISLSSLLFCLIYTAVVLTKIDPAAALEDLPLGSIWVSFVLQLINLGMLAIAVNDLGRTMFVDRSIAHLGSDAATGGISILSGKPYAGAWQQRIDAPREGYVQGVDLAAIAAVVGAHARVRIVAAPGQHVLREEPLVLLGKANDGTGKIRAAIPIGDYRSSAQNAVFHIRLLVEIGARALSPGINDFYTAMACADKLACAMLGQEDSWIDEGDVALSAQYPHFELPGHDFFSLFAGPLDAFRQAAAPYPAVAIRMIDNYARVAALTKAPQLQSFLEDQARALAEHAASRAERAADAAAISKRIAQWSDVAGDAAGNAAGTMNAPKPR